MRLMPLQSFTMIADEWLMQSLFIRNAQSAGRNEYDNTKERTLSEINLQSLRNCGNRKARYYLTRLDDGTRIADGWHILTAGRVIRWQREETAKSSTNWAHKTHRGVCMNCMCAACECDQLMVPFCVSVQTVNKGNRLKCNAINHPLLSRIRIHCGLWISFCLSQTNNSS